MDSLPTDDTPREAAACDSPVPCVEVLGGNQARTESLMLAGLELLLVARPAGTGAGGDLYCVHACGEPAVAKIVLLDVTGHGVRAASVAQAVHGLLHRHSAATQPSQLLELLNREFPRVAPPGILATSLCLVYDSGRSALRYANGGQPRLLFWSVRKRRWDSRGPGWDSSCGVPFGVTEGACYEDEKLPLEPGDLLLLFSDGVLETTSPTGGLLQADGALRLAQECTDEIPKGFSPALSDLAEAFLKKLRSFHGRADFADDLTLLWIRRPVTLRQDAI